MGEFILGHRIGSVFGDFPHVCPGLGCAIEKWLQQQATAARVTYAPYDYNVFSEAAYDVRARFWAQVVKCPSGCWEWQGTQVSEGYGRFGFDYRMYAAHRVAYVLHHGAIDPNLVIDHLCRNTRCVNPAHLEPVTQSVNILRSPIAGYR